MMRGCNGGIQKSEPGLAVPSPTMELYLSELQNKGIISLDKYRCRYKHLPVTSYTDSDMHVL